MFNKSLLVAVLGLVLGGALAPPADARTAERPRHYALEAREPFRIGRCEGHVSVYVTDDARSSFLKVSAFKEADGATGCFVYYTIEFTADYGAWPWNGSRRVKYSGYLYMSPEDYYSPDPAILELRCRNVRDVKVTIHQILWA